MSVQTRRGDGHAPAAGHLVRAFAAAVLLVAGAGCAEAAACADYLRVAARAIKPRVEGLRLIEREAADRIQGLDTRPYPFLVGQARAVAEAVGEARALQEEDDLDKCAAPVPHVRRVCATAARALASAMEEQAAAAASPISKQIYAQAMAICEGLVGLAPLRTSFRTPD